MVLSLNHYDLSVAKNMRISVSFCVVIILGALSLPIGEPARAASAQDSPVPVTTEQVASLRLFPERNAPAQAVSLNDTELSAEIQGQIDAINVRVGDSVQAGDVVARVACQDHRDQLQQARAALQSAEAQQEYAASRLDRASKLASSKSISQEQLRERESTASVSDAELLRQRARVQLARRTVRRCNIRAPFDAVVVERWASAGEFVGPGARIVRLLDSRQVEVSAQVQEQDIASLEQADQPRLVLHDSSYPLQLRVVLPLVDSRLRSFEVRLDFADATAPPGSVGRLEWHSPTAHLPADLLVRREAGLGVFLAEANRARFHVLPGALEGRAAPTTLADKARIIIAGRYGLRDGDRIQVVEE